ncbi:MAG: hypothetical protein ACP5GU_05160 [Thermoprotei archaeon]|jgi:adenine/guanine phosphoribosyltransferase-like PRPP-binding protein
MTLQKNESTRLDEIENELNAVNIIKILKNNFLTYSEIAQLTGISPNLLSRYASGKMIPNKIKTERILRLATTRWVISKVVQRIIHDYLNSDGAINLTPDYLRLISVYVKFMCNKNIDKVITTTSPIAIIAAYISNALNKPLVLVYDEKYIPNDSSIKVQNEYGEMFHISKKALKNDDRVIVFEENPNNINRQILLYQLLLVTGAVIDRIFYLYSLNKSDVKKLMNLLRFKNKNQIVILYEA